MTSQFTQSFSCVLLGNNSLGLRLFCICCSCLFYFLLLLLVAWLDFFNSLLLLLLQFCESPNVGLVGTITTNEDIKWCDWKTVDAVNRVSVVIKLGNRIVTLGCQLEHLAIFILVTLSKLTLLVRLKVVHLVRPFKHGFRFVFVSLGL